jgi:hypothetical protein
MTGDGAQGEMFKGTGKVLAFCTAGHQDVTVFLYGSMPPCADQGNGILQNLLERIGRWTKRRVDHRGPGAAPSRR